MSSYDREEVARARKLFPLWTTTVSVGQFFKLLGDEQQTGNGDLPDDLSSKETLVGYLNKLSEAVREQHTKERIIFCLSESKYEEEDYSTGIRYRPDFVAIKIGPEANPPSLVTIEREVTDVPLSKQDHELAWSQLETTGGIYSQGAASVVQSASYTGTSSKLGLTSFRWWAYSFTPSGPSFGSTSPMPEGSAKQRPLISIPEIPSLRSGPHSPYLQP